MNKTKQNSQGKINFRHNVLVLPKLEFEFHDETHGLSSAVLVYLSTGTPESARPHQIEY
jgi:hypothetical protein